MLPNNLPTKVSASGHHGEGDSRWGHQLNGT